MEETETENTAQVRLAFRVAYLGDRYFGSQMQAKERTVEGEFVASCVRLGLFSDYRDAGFLAAGRTDRGVHARGQVYALTTRLPARAIGFLNWQLPRDCWVSGYAEVPHEFHPRYDAKNRTYRYFFGDGDLDIEAMDRGADCFVGEHDFSPFARVKDKNPYRTVLDAQVFQEGEFCVLEVTAESFLWHMVRYMASALLLIGKGDWDESAIDECLAGGGTRSIGPAPPDYLVLWDVDCGISFVPIPDIGRSMEYVWDLHTHHTVMAQICESLIGDSEESPLP
jgi:tRNA pseudouridine38-40 synthase